MNVLAVLDWSVSKLRGEGYPSSAGELRQARDAVAELIEADKEYDGALIAVVRTGLDGQADSAMPGEATARVEAAIARRAAALSRVQGVQS